MARLAFALAALWLTLAGASASERVGIAFVQAPEQGGGVCTGLTPEQAFACAKQECTSSGAAEEDCLRTTWCFPSGWSVDVFLLHNEGVHWHEVSCGWATRSTAERAAAITCDQKERQYVVDCTIAQIYDPDGKPQLK